MNYIQQPLIFECNNESLLAIISRPEQPRSRGVVIVVASIYTAYRDIFLAA